MLESLVDQLGQELQMKHLISSSQEGNSYTLPFEDDIEVQVTQTPYSYLFKGIIGPCPPSNKAAFLTKTMEANLFGRGTRSAIIGLTEDGNMLTLSTELDYNSTYKEFKEKLEDFVTIVDYWRNEALAQQR